MRTNDAPQGAGSITERACDVKLGTDGPPADHEVKPHHHPKEPTMYGEESPSPAKWKRALHRAGLHNGKRYPYSAFTMAGCFLNILIILAMLASIAVGATVWIRNVSVHAEHAKCNQYTALISDREVRWQYNSYWSQTCLVQLSTGRWVTLKYYLTYFPVDLTGDVPVQR